MPKSPFQKLDEKVEQSRFDRFDQNMRITREIFNQIKSNALGPQWGETRKPRVSGREQPSFYAENPEMLVGEVSPPGSLMRQPKMIEQIQTALDDIVGKAVGSGKRRLSGKYEFENFTVFGEAQPDDVVWICQKCHTKIHRNFKRHQIPKIPNLVVDLCKHGYWNCPAEPAINFETDFDYDKAKNREVSRYEDEIYNEMAIFGKHVL